MSIGLLPSNENIEFIKNYNYKQKDNDIRFTSIILLTYNKLEYTKICIESIRKFTPKGKYEIIVVDNNSNDGTLDWLKEQDDLKVIYNNYNAGFPKGCNQGIKISKGDSILLLNNDTVVTPNWLNILDKTLYSSEKIGAVGSITNSCSNGQAINVNYNNIDEMINFSKSINTYNENNHEFKLWLVGFCFLVKKNILNEVGYLDEIFTPGNFEDNDLSFRILEKGYSLVLCRDSFIHHYGSVSFKENELEYQNINFLNLKKFNAKWGFDLIYSTYPRYELINLIDKDINDNINILEVGCGAGATLLALKNLYKNANLYGIEISENAGKVARGIADIIIGNIENVTLPYEEKYFDYIILGDVLEHLVDPWKTLDKLRKYLKDDGYIIASIPNIMHIGVIRQILTGNFTYEDAGILDRTHLRFFTAYEIQQMLLKCGFNLDNIYSKEVFISEDEKNLINDLCKITNEGYKQQYLTYQYILKASKTK